MGDEEGTEEGREVQNASEGIRLFFLCLFWNLNKSCTSLLIAETAFIHKEFHKSYRKEKHLNIH